MRYGGTCKPPLAIAEYCLLTSMMLKNSASCSIGSLKSSLSMCDKMVAGKKYLVCVCVEGACVEEGVCVKEEVCVHERCVKRMVSFSFQRTGNGTSFSYLQLFSSS